MKYQTKRGFTLVELLLVITIIAILTVISITTYAGISYRATVSGARTTLSTLGKALDIYKSQYGKYPPNYSNPTTSMTEMQALLTEYKLFTPTRYNASISYTVGKYEPIVYCTSADFSKYILVSAIGNQDGTFTNTTEMLYVSSFVTGKRTYDTTLTDSVAGARFCQSVQGNLDILIVRWLYDTPTLH